MKSSFSKKLGLISVVFFVLNGVPHEGKAWGFFMHKKINSHAIYILPPELMTLYKNNEFTLKVYATKPDNRRYIDPNEGPRHFIDLETYMAIDSGFIGLNYMTAKELYSQCVKENHEFGQDGILPWHCLLMMHRLTEAMKGSRLEDILQISGELGHYISDAHVPLHTTYNYNGQRSGQHGIHGLWESTIPELEFEQYDYWIDEELSYWENPLDRLWSIIVDSHNLLFSVFSAEYCVSEDVTIPKHSYRYRQGRAHRTYSKAFCARYAELCEGHIEERYRQAVHAVASVWFTCWVNAGKPQFQNQVIPINPSDQDELNYPSSCDHH